MATKDGYWVPQADRVCLGHLVRLRGPIRGTEYLGVYQQPLSCTVTNYCDSIHHNQTRAADFVASPRTGFVDYAPQFGNQVKTAHRVWNGRGIYS